MVDIEPKRKSQRSVRSLLLAFACGMIAHCSCASRSRHIAHFGSSLVDGSGRTQATWRLTDGNPEIQVLDANGGQGMKLVLGLNAHALSPQPGHWRLEWSVDSTAASMFSFEFINEAGGVIAQCVGSACAWMGILHPEEVKIGYCDSSDVNEVSTMGGFKFVDRKWIPLDGDK